MHFGSDKLIILGSGGGRYHCATQYLSTGGLIFRPLDGKYQFHLDPGPGALRDLRDYGIDRQATTHVFLTHPHTDHSMSVPGVLEALQPNFSLKHPTGTFIAPREYLSTRVIDPFYLNLMKSIIPVSAHENFIIDKHITCEATATQHGRPENVGFIFRINAPNQQYSLAFTSDTANFPEYIDQYKGVDILVANLLRPDNYTCRGHLCTYEFLPLLQEIKPRICILTHFGWRMVNPETGSQVERQVSIIQQSVGSSTLVIGANDGLIIEFAQDWETFYNNL